MATRRRLSRKKQDVDTDLNEGGPTMEALEQRQRELEERLRQKDEELQVLREQQQQPRAADVVPQENALLQTRIEEIKRECEAAQRKLLESKLHEEELVKERHDLQKHNEKLMQDLDQIKRDFGSLFGEFEKVKAGQSPDLAQADARARELQEQMEKLRTSVADWERKSRPWTVAAELESLQAVASTGLTGLSVEQRHQVRLYIGDNKLDEALRERASYVMRLDVLNFCRKAQAKLDAWNAAGSVGLFPLTKNETSRIPGLKVYLDIFDNVGTQELVDAVQKLQQTNKTPKLDKWAIAERVMQRPIMRALTVASIAMIIYALLKMVFDSPPAVAHPTS